MILLHGCATNLYLNPVKSDQQNSIYQEGTKSLISKKKIIVAIRPSKEIISTNVRPSFIVTVNNTSNESFVFSTENINVMFNGKKIKVFTYQELVEEIENQRKSAALSAALLGMAQVMQASSPQYHSGNYNATNYGSGDNTNTTGTYTGYTYNPVATIQAQTAANSVMLQNMQMINNSANKSLDRLQNTILMKQTVLPNEWYGGYINTEPLNMKEGEGLLTVNLDVAGEKHNFEFCLFKNEESYKKSVLEENKKLDTNKAVSTLKEGQNKTESVEKNGDKSSKLKELNLAIEKSPNDIDALFNRALFYEKMDNNKKAFEDYTKVIHLSEKWLQQNRNKINNKSIDEKSFQKNYMSLVMAYNNRGMIYKNEKLYDKSIDDFSKCIKLYPEGMIYFNRGNVYRRVNKLDLALGDYSKAIGIDPDRDEYYIARAHIYDRLNENEKFLSDINKAIKLNPNNPEAYRISGMYWSKFDYKKAIQYFTKAIELKPFYYLYYHFRGIAYYYSGSTDMAIDDLTKAVELNNSFSLGYNMRGQALFEIKNYRLALDDFTKAISINPSDDEAYYYRCLCLTKLGDLTSSFNDCRIAASLGNAGAKDILERYDQLKNK